MTTLEKLMLAAFVLTAIQILWVNLVPQTNRHRRS